MFNGNTASVCIVDGLARPDEEQPHAALPCLIYKLQRPLPAGRTEGPRGRQAKVFPDLLDCGRSVHTVALLHTIVKPGMPPQNSTFVLNPKMRA